jgi:hypothetical protein
MAVTSLAKSKRAVFFSVVALVFVAILMFFYITVNSYSPLSKSEVIESRVLTMDNFIEDVEHDIERGLYIASMRSLIGMSEFLGENGSFIVNMSKSFNEIMINGTVDNNIINITKNASFGDWMDKITTVGNRIGVQLQFQDLQVTPFQDDPWTVKVTVTGTMLLNDTRGIASWNRAMNITSEISIIQFEDPLYLITSKGKLSNPIERSNYTSFVSGSDASNLIDHANRSYYIATNLSPNFLMRFEGNTSASKTGIESIVNVDTKEV